MKAGVRLSPLNSWPALQVFSSRFSIPLARYLWSCLGLQLLSSGMGQAVSSQSWICTLAQYFICKATLSIPAGSRHCLLWNCLAPAVLLPCCSTSTLTPTSSFSLCLHEGSGRIEFFFFFVFNILTFDFAVERNLGLIVEVFLCVKTRMGSKGFGKQRGLRHLNHPESVLSAPYVLGLPCAQGVEHPK